MSFQKLSRTFPEFKPHWNASFGAKELYAVLQDCGISLEDFQGRRYIRLTQLKHLIEAGDLDGTLRWRPDATRRRSAGR